MGKICKNLFSLLISSPKRVGDEDKTVSPSASPSLSSSSTASSKGNNNNNTAAQQQQQPTISEEQLGEGEKQAGKGGPTDGATETSKKNKQKLEPTEGRERKKGKKEKPATVIYPLVSPWKRHFEEEE
jgi:hypothetical protein